MPDTNAGTSKQLRPAPMVGLRRSVLANWAWYAVVVLSGFLVPRLVDRHQGQEILGVWDFGWSLVVYVSFLSFGVTSAVNRYVAGFRASADWTGLNQTVSSSLLLLSAAACLGLVLAGGLAMAVPWLLPDTPAGHVRTAQWCVLLLAANSAVQLPAGVFNGIITGLERFDLLNVIRISRDLAVLVGMAVALLTGRGLVTMACVLIAGEVLGTIAKWAVARRICRELHVSPRYCSRRVMGDLLSFGGKTVIQSAARAGIYQGVSLLVGVLSGPAALAVFARQRALVLHLLRFVKQYAQVFIPRSSILHARQDHDRQRETLVQSTRYGLYITLPFILVLLLMGGPLLSVWMGPAYEAPLVLGILALGHLPAVSQLGVYSILMGLNRHGRAAWFDLAAAVVGLAAAALALGPMEWGLTGAALAVSVPVALSGGVILPIYACRVVDLRVGTYARRTLPGPVAACAPLALLLIAARLAWPASPLTALTAGLSVGGVVTVVIYWQRILPSRPRHILDRRLGSLFCQPSAPPVADGVPEP